MKIEKVLIAGAGAVGLLVAETIYRSLPESVFILAKGERLDRYRKQGLTVNGERINFRLTPEEKAGLIIVACKYHHLDTVIKDMAPSVGEDTIIVSLLNGISSEEIIGRSFGRERLPLAMIIGTDALHKENGTVYSQKGVIHFGDGAGMNGDRERSIADFFTRAGVPFELETNMKRALWYKYMINVGSNQNTAVLRLPYKAIMNRGGPGEIKEARLLIERTMREVIAVANAEGVDLREDDIGKFYDSVNHLSPGGYTSTCQDILAGRKTEVEMFSLALMELAKKHNIPVPINETLYLQLRTLEQRPANLP